MTQNRDHRIPKEEQKSLGPHVKKGQEHTLVEIDRKEFALLNTLDEEEMTELVAHYPGLAKRKQKWLMGGDKSFWKTWRAIFPSGKRHKYKVVIGEGSGGSGGKVRLTRQVIQQEGGKKSYGDKYTAIKKTIHDPSNPKYKDFDKIVLAEAEYDFHKQVLASYTDLKDLYVPIEAGAKTEKTRKKGTKKQTFYHVMEYADLGDGRNLIELIHQQPSPLTEKEKQIVLLHITESILHAVTLFHRHEIYHRDLKAENFLAFSNGKIKLADFGAAMVSNLSFEKQVSDKSDRRYWPPEYFSGKFFYFDTNKIMQYGDSWSMGLALLEFYGVDLHNYFSSKNINDIHWQQQPLGWQQTIFDWLLADNPRKSAEEVYKLFKKDFLPVFKETYGYVSLDDPQHQQMISRIFEKLAPQRSQQENNTCFTDLPSELPAEKIKQEENSPLSRWNTDMDKKEKELNNIINQSLPSHFVNHKLSFLESQQVRIEDLTDDDWTTDEEPEEEQQQKEELPDGASSSSPSDEEQSEKKESSLANIITRLNEILPKLFAEAQRLIASAYEQVQKTIKQYEEMIEQLSQAVDKKHNVTSNHSTLFQPKNKKGESTEKEKSSSPGFTLVPPTNEDQDK